MGGGRIHVYVNVVMPGTDPKSHKIDPRQIEFDNFVSEVYTQKWKKGQLIVFIDVEMAVLEFGIEWGQSQRLAGMTKSDFPPQGII